VVLSRFTETAATIISTDFPMVDQLPPELQEQLAEGLSLGLAFRDIIMITKKSKKESEEMTQLQPELECFLKMGIL